MIFHTICFIHRMKWQLTAMVLFWGSASAWSAGSLMLRTSATKMFANPGRYDCANADIPLNLLNSKTLELLGQVCVPRCIPSLEKINGQCRSGSTCLPVPKYHSGSEQVFGASPPASLHYACVPRCLDGNAERCKAFLGFDSAPVCFVTMCAHRAT